MDNAKKSIITAASVVFLIVLFFLSSSLGEDVSKNEIVVNQFPFTGTMAYWAQPGFHWQWFGTATSYDKSFQHWFAADETKGGGTDEAQKIVFNDAGIGWISGSARIKLPHDANHLSKIQEDFGSMSALQKDLVQETIDKVIFATGPLMSSYESYAIEKNALINYIEDQLQHGIYQTSITEEKTIDPLTKQEKTIRIAERVVSEDVADFGWKRQEIAPFKEYGLTVAAVSVDDIVYEERIMTQIQEQQNARMQVQTAIAEAQEAEQQAQKAEAVGRQKAAEARATQEVEKVKAVVKAEQLRAVAKLEKEAAEFTKQKLILEGEGAAAKKRLIMQADGALQQKLHTYLEAQKVWADAVKNYEGNWVPQMMLGGSGETSANSVAGGGAQQLINLLMAKTANDLSLDMKVPKQ